MICIIDYGMGNLGSLVNMFKRIGASAQIVSDPELINRAEKLVLPGVGAFDSAMERINSNPALINVLNRKVLHDKVPVLGICLGMQLITDSSEEGSMSGLGWIAGSASKFPILNNLKVPHMGWNVALPNVKSRLTKNLSEEPRYYFVHSYCVQVKNPKHSIMRTHYGIDFDSAIGRDNIFGVQFHPEKSHSFGMQILKNFSEI